jgi:murein DD-endopeptidase MepM/ murein hydrolase activator NlpD
VGGRDQEGSSGPRRRTVKILQPCSVGQQLAACGNSGNSTEPHLHFQLMDLPSPFIAAGLPFSVNYLSGGEERRGMPAARQPVRSAASTRQPA